MKKKLFYLGMCLLIITVNIQAKDSIYNVHSFGANGDGHTDNTSAFQSALDTAGATGGIVWVPSGTFLISGSLLVPSGVTLKGVWEAAHVGVDKGSVLFVTGNRGNEDATPFIRLSANSAVRGLSIFYPEQTIDDVQPYPWCIQGLGGHCSIIDVLIVNPYKAVDFSSHPSYSHNIRNLYGQPLKSGIFIDKCYDIGRIENVHFNPNPWTLAKHPMLSRNYRH